MQPPASLQALGDPIYEAFYGLKEQPFAITTDPRFFYLSASHQRAFAELLNGLKRREGLMLVTGDTGTGKTTLCRAVTEALGERTFTAMILNPYMVGAEVLRIVLRDFGLVSHEELRRGALASADTAQLLDTLEGFLKSLIPIGSHAVIVLDEAQALDPVVLDQIRLLTALEHEGQRLVQVILCGQPGLLHTLKSESLFALNERITRRVVLMPLPADQVEAYIEHRLSVAGGSNAVSFDPDAVRVVGELSRGLPRRVNVLCDRALQEGRIAGLSTITADLVKRAARALAGAHQAPLLPEPRPTESASPPTVELHEVPAPEQRTEDAPVVPASRRGRNIAIAMAALVLLSVAGYLAYAYSVMADGATTRIAAPRAPARDVGAKVVPAGIPTDDEMRAMFGEAAVPAPATAAPLVPGLQPVPPAPPSSGQLPHNRDQLN